MTSWVRRRWLGIVFLVATSCAEEPAHFDVRYAPGFQRQGVSLSIFGVFKDGRLSQDTPAELLPKLSPALGPNPCPAAYGADFVQTKAKLAQIVDDDTMAHGITDELLDQFGPAAKGDLVMTLVMAGESTIAADAGRAPSAPPQPPPVQTRTRGGRGRRSRMSGSPDRARGPDRGVFELSASLYSIRLHRSVAILSMTYSGRRLDEALASFRQELAKELPGAVCTGWNWDAAPDPDRVRDLGDR
jgi:hypothetical protein